MASFTLHLIRAGRFRTDAALRAALGPALTPGLVRGGLVVQAQIQRSSPVKTGTLRRSWTTTTVAEWTGDLLRVTVGTIIVYARYQNTRTKNRGYVEAGLNAARPQAVAVIRAALAGLGPAVWERR